MSGPFVLLDDARSESGTVLFSSPAEIMETRDPEKVRERLAGLRDRQRHAAGFLAYEAGYALESCLAPLRLTPPADAPPLLWFGLFERVERVEAARFLPDPAGVWAGRVRPLIERDAYETAVERILAHILDGDIYQANFTFQAEVATAGSPLALYAAIRARARMGHGGIVFTGDHWILSFSPELFFTLRDGRIAARPMKGTAERRADPVLDKAAAEALRRDPKQRAENLMIVDLLRNDLSRTAKPGSVKAPDLFEVESYPTVHQMTSTVTAELEEGLGPIDLIETLFPCGSITGAPKIRAMEIIAGLEREPRGVYTGAIGRVAPDGEAEFNVAIRTLTLRDGESVARMGLGSGIVADSRADDEWRECLAKGVFVHDPNRRFDLFETMRFDPHDGIVALDRHLARIERSAAAFDFRFNRHDARNELQAATFRAPPSKVRLMLSQTGAVAIELRPIGAGPAEPVRVAAAPLPVAPDDFRLRHKTTDRAFYDQAREASGADEVVFMDEAGYLTEGSFTNLFVERGGRLLTPPLSRGLLPGVLREGLIEEGRAEEADLVEADLVNGFYIGNSLRGLMRAALVR